MTAAQKVIKYGAIAFAVLLIVSIFGGVLQACGLLGTDAVLDEIKTYSVEQEVLRLEVEVGAAEFAIRSGEQFSVESNLKYLTVEEKDGTLTVREDRKNGKNYEGPVLTLYVPEGYCFEEIDIETGAAVFTVHELSAKTVTLMLGAGQVDIDLLNASEKAEIQGGAGELIIKSGSIKSLDLDMGIGELNLTAALTGDSSLVCGVGESNITLLGAESDYQLRVNKGIGSAWVNGESISGNSTHGSGDRAVQIDCGVGAVNISFQQETR